jgi:hypothetical protein
MEKYALLARLEAKVGKEDEVVCFSVSTDEPDTVNWYGLQMGPSTNFLQKHILKVKQKL